MSVELLNLACYRVQAKPLAAGREGLWERCPQRLANLACYKVQAKPPAAGGEGVCWRCLQRLAIFGKLLQK